MPWETTREKFFRYVGLVPVPAVVVGIGVAVILWWALRHDHAITSPSRIGLLVGSVLGAAMLVFDGYNFFAAFTP